MEVLFQTCAYGIVRQGAGLTPHVNPHFARRNHCETRAVLVQDRGVDSAHRTLARWVRAVAMRPVSAPRQLPHNPVLEPLCRPRSNPRVGGAGRSGREPLPRPHAMGKRLACLQMFMSPHQPPCTGMPRHLPRSPAALNPFRTASTACSPCPRTCTRITGSGGRRESTSPPPTRACSCCCRGRSCTKTSTW